jgi:transcriptional regulator GlxA family with amidase domain
MPRNFNSYNWEEMAVKAKFSARTLAKNCGVSSRTLSRYFHEQHGMSAGRWLREIRLMRAYLALSHSRSVKEVAWELHYKQVSHFSRDFKNRFGVSPSMVLNTHSEKVNDETSRESKQLTFCFYCGRHREQLCRKLPFQNS